MVRIQSGPLFKTQINTKMAGEFELTPRKGPYVGRTLSDVHLIRHELEMQNLKNKQLSQTVRQIIDVAKLPKEEFTWYKLLGGRIMTRTRKNRRGGQERTAAEVRAQQDAQNAARLAEGLSANRRQNEIEAAQREGRNIFSVAALPGAVGALPSRSPALVRSPRGISVAEYESMLPPRRLDFDNVDGGKRRKHIKSKKHILRRRGRHTRRRLA